MTLLSSHAPSHLSLALPTAINTITDDTFTCTTTTRNHLLSFNAPPTAGWDDVRKMQTLKYNDIIYKMKRKK